MSTIQKDNVLGLVPARGGSKSLPLKNIAPLGGIPLIAHAIQCAKAVMPDVVQRLVCSTDHDRIASIAKEWGAEVIMRPAEYATDMVRVEEAIKYTLNVINDETGFTPEIVVLFQPTSPFVKSEHIQALVDKLKQDETLDSAITIADIPHNLHALNQRIITEDNLIDFKFKEERVKAYNKQLKPTHFRFGNLVAFRSQTILDGNSCFGTRSGYHVIDREYATDVDGPDDFDYASYQIERNKVEVIN